MTLFRRLALCLALLPLPVMAETPTDLLFREGTLDAVGLDQTIVYSRSVANSLAPEAAVRDTGDIALSIIEEDARVARLEFRQDGKQRGLGRFPATVGNPMIMYFYETVVRDMADSAGGSPFYIRNRVKDALSRPTEVETGTATFDGQTVETRTVRLQPFLNDPNYPRMRGFGDLELRVTMSDAVPGWYLSFVAETGTGDDSVYRSELRFETVEDNQ